MPITKSPFPHNVYANDLTCIIANGPKRRSLDRQLKPYTGGTMILTIRDETASGSLTNELTLDVLSESITVRELIRSRVYQEVQDYNLHQRTGEIKFRGLVTPTDAEQSLNGAKLPKPREIDWKAQFDKACEAFTRN